MAQKKKKTDAQKTTPKKKASAKKSTTKTSRKKEIINLVKSLRKEFGNFKLDPKEKQNIDFYLNKIDKFADNL